MKRLIWTLVTCCVALSAVAIEPRGPVREVASGFSFTEGPAYDPDSGMTYFTDIPNNKIHRVDADGNVDVFTDSSNHANGLLVQDGNLYACEMDGALVVYDLKTKRRQVLAERYDGKRFNACNDLVLDASGGIYFTDPLFRAPQPLPQGVQAVYYRAADGKVTRLTGDMPAPNGIALSPDGKKLYVAPSADETMLHFDVEGPGKLGPAQPLVQVQQPKGKRGTGGDGMVVDVDGNLYFTTNRGVEVVSPEGVSLHVIEFPQQPANVTFIGPDRKTMLVTARTALYSVSMPVAGLSR